MSFRLSYKIAFFLQKYQKFCCQIANFVLLSLGNRAEVVEWQTRRTQNPLLATTCGFKSRLRHQTKALAFASAFFITSAGQSRLTRFACANTLIRHYVPYGTKMWYQKFCYAGQTTRVFLLCKSVLSVKYWTNLFDFVILRKKLCSLIDVRGRKYENKN